MRGRRNGKERTDRAVKELPRFGKITKLQGKRLPSSTPQAQRLHGVWGRGKTMVYTLQLYHEHNETSLVFP